MQSLSPLGHWLTAPLFFYAQTGKHYVVIT